jgi:hypothetical protein
MSIDLGEVVWVVRGLGDAFTLRGCAERLEVTPAELGYRSAQDLLVATADHVIDEAMAQHPGATHEQVCAMLWSICEKFLLAPNLGQTMSLPG